MLKPKRLLAPLLTLVLLALAGPLWAQDEVLRFVQNGNLTILDPILRHSIMRPLGRSVRIGFQPLGCFLQSPRTI
jgi:hypothetical protein